MATIKTFCGNLWECDFNLTDDNNYEIIFPPLSGCLPMKEDLIKFKITNSNDESLNGIYEGNILIEELNNGYILNCNQFEVEDDETIPEIPLTEQISEVYDAICDIDDRLFSVEENNETTDSSVSEVYNALCDLDDRLFAIEQALELLTGDTSND